MVAGIIRKYAPGVELSSVKIFPDHSMKTTCNQLVSALKWCLKKNIPVVNMSDVTTDPYDLNQISKINKMQRKCVRMAHCFPYEMQVAIGRFQEIFRLKPCENSFI
jgi:hypothetical protein